MVSLRLTGLALIALSVFAVTRPAQAADTDWQKTYPASSKPSLTFTTGDASAEVHSCGDCREIRVRVEWNDRHATDYTITEFQSGNHVNFELKEKRGFAFHVTIGYRHEPHVSVETPSVIDLEARTSDGGLKVYGLQGEMRLRTSDGSMDVSDVNGGLHLESSDGSIRVHNAAGTLESRSSDGKVQIEGKFTGVDVHTSDGGLDLTLADGSHLTSSSRVESSDGGVTVHLPKNLAADLEVRSSDGHIDCKLPLVMEGYDSKSDSGHSIRGRLNGGGVPLAIHTHDGNATIDAI